MVYQTEKTLQEMGDKLDASDKAEVEAKLDSLKKALQGSDTAAIKSATDELTQAFYKVSEKLYQQTAPRPRPGHGRPAARRQQWRRAVLRRRLRSGRRRQEMITL